MDKIQIKKIAVFAKHGVFPEEQVLGQKFLISVILYTQIREAGLTDQLAYSIHYGEVCHFIQSFVEGRQFQLIEAIAEKLSESLLLEFKGLEKVEVCVEKPWAPIGLPLKTVSVTIERGWHKSYIALGSNLGDKEAYLQFAVTALKQLPKCRVLQVSRFIATKPYGPVAQDPFLNGCVELITLLPPLELLTALQQIEQDAGRTRDIHWGPRTLDLDIIFYDDWVYNNPQLQIPHRDMHNREFVLAPLAEIAPYYMHPILKKTVGELAEGLKG